MCRKFFPGISGGGPDPPDPPPPLDPPLRMHLALYNAKTNWNNIT